MILITLADLAELSNAPLLEKIKTLTQVTDAIEVAPIIQVFYGLNLTHKVVAINNEYRVYCNNIIVHYVDTFRNGGSY